MLIAGTVVFFGSNLESTYEVLNTAVGWMHKLAIIVECIGMRDQNDKIIDIRT
jgi:hypothetical protein